MVTHRVRLIFIGIVAILAGVWYALRTEPQPPRPGAHLPDAPAAGAVPADRQPDQPVRVPPTRLQPPVRVPPTRIDLTPGRDPDGDVTGVHGDDVHAGFDAEALDESWAAEAEGEVRQRAEGAAAAAGVRLEQVECRAARCRITLTGDSDVALGRAIARLEDTAGLDGLADALVLTNTEAGEGDARVLRVYAVFDRAP